MEPDENTDPAILERKRARLGEAHVAPLTSLCDEIARERRLPAGAVPYPDPDHGGVEARALFVLSHPGAAAPESRLLSLGNHDDMSKLALAECVRVGLRVDEIAHWNAVPFPPATRTLSTAEKRDGLPWLARVVALLPRLEVVALLGRPAQWSWRQAFPRASEVAVVEGPNPGWPGISAPGARERLAESFDAVAEVLEASG